MRSIFFQRTLLQVKKFTIYLQPLISYMRASRLAAGARVSEPWVCGTGASLFQLAVKAPLALLVCQPEHQRSESATSSSWVCATNGHLDPLTNLMKPNAHSTQRSAFVWHLKPERMDVDMIPGGHPLHLYFSHF